MGKKIVRLLGVGFDGDDGHLRITRGERYDVVMGSTDSHEYMHRLVERIEAELERQHRTLEELSTEELGLLVEKLKTTPRDGNGT